MLLKLCCFSGLGAEPSTYVVRSPRPESSGSRELAPTMTAGASSLEPGDDGLRDLTTYVEDSAPTLERLV